MTRSQFNALAELAGLRDSRARQGAYLVLIEGVKQVTAALAVGASQQTVSRAVRRIRETQRAARMAI
jgi:DNA-directed RNA polymerase specialized sigma24 family protein